MFSRKELIIETRKLKIKAHQKPSTSKPGTIAAVAKMIITLMTNRKSPKVSRVTGSVNNISNGLRNVFNSARTMAAMIATIGESTCTPSSK